MSGISSSRSRCVEITPTASSASAHHDRRHRTVQGDLGVQHGSMSSAGGGFDGGAAGGSGDGVRYDFLRSITE